MRIISGFLKGRSVGGYDVKGTRPTMDRVKESVFASIQNKMKEIQFKYKNRSKNIFYFYFF